MPRPSTLMTLAVALAASAANLSAGEPLSLFDVQSRLRQAVAKTQASLTVRE